MQEIDLEIALWIILCLDKSINGLSETFFRRQTLYRTKEVNMVLESLLKHKFLMKNIKGDYILIKKIEQLDVSDIITCLYNFEWLDTYIEKENEKKPFIKRDFVVQCYTKLVHDFALSCKGIPMKQ